MANNKNRVPMPSQEPEIRINNFDEVELGYTDEMAVTEAKRCLQCRHKPCVSGCPVGVDIPTFMKHICENSPEDGYDVISKSNALPAVCGRVCPQEKQCEARCVRGRNGSPVAIGKLERYCADWHIKNSNKYGKKISKIHKNKEKVAIIGAGPSGLTCARELALFGYDVTIYEALHSAGGVLSYGIPEFRLPRNILNWEIDNLISMGVKILKNMVIGRILSIDDIFNMGNKAVYISTGAGLPKFMGIEGEELPGVYSANEFLTRINLMHAYSPEYDTPINIPDEVVVVGGGNVAMDAARCAKRLGAKRVTVIYRRSESEMPARREEIEHAKEEKIEFLFLSNPVCIKGEGKAEYIEYVSMILSEADESGRRRPIQKSNTRFKIKCDCVVIAIGNMPGTLLTGSSNDVKCDNRGRIITDDNLSTSKPMTYAGGDAVTGAATVILAMEAGKKAAKHINEMLTGIGDVET